MESVRKIFVYHNLPNRRFGNHIHVLLIFILISVQVLFILECCGILHSDCYSKGKRMVMPQNDTSDSETEDQIDVLLSEFTDHQAVPVTAITHTVEYIKDTTYTPKFFGRTQRNIDNGNEFVNNSQNDDHLKKKSRDVYEQQVKRQIQLRHFCRSKDSPVKVAKRTSMNLLYSDIQGVIYCYVPKAACTNWKRMLQVFDGNIQHPLAITDKRRVHRLRYSHLNRLAKPERDWRKDLYYSFTFVRHPFERLLSVYRNKFLDPYSPTFQRKYGSRILKLFRANLTSEQYKQGKNITFNEFINYLIIVYNSKGSSYFDEHWQIMNNLCHPCSMKYNFIGKMETLLDDATQVLQELDLHEKVKFPANATDKYKHEVKTMMKKYYGTISKRAIKKLYEIYEDDFLSFGYKVPDYL